MSYRDLYVLNLGLDNTGKTINAQLRDQTDSVIPWVGDALPRVAVEVPASSGSYLLDTSDHPDGFSGSCIFTDAGILVATLPTSAGVSQDPDAVDGVEPGLTEAEWRRAVISILGGLVAGVQPLSASTYTFSNWSNASQKHRLEYSADAVGNRLSKTVLDLDP